MKSLSQIISRKVATYRISVQNKQNIARYTTDSTLIDPYFVEFNNRNRVSISRIGRRNNVKIGYSPKGVKSPDYNTIDIFEKQESQDHYLGSILLEKDINTTNPKEILSIMREGIKEIVV